MKMATLNPMESYNKPQTNNTCIQVLKLLKKFQDLHVHVGGNEPTPSQLWCDALPVELPSPWDQGGGEWGSCIQVFLVLITYYKALSSSLMKHVI